MVASKSSARELPVIVSRPSCPAPLTWVFHHAWRSRSKGSNGSTAAFAVRRQVAPAAARSVTVICAVLRCAENFTDSTGISSPPRTTVMSLIVTDGAASSNARATGGASSEAAESSCSSSLTPFISSAVTCTSPPSSIAGTHDNVTCAAVRSRDWWRTSSWRKRTVRKRRPETSPILSRSPAHQSIDPASHRVPSSVAGTAASSASTTSSAAPPRITTRTSVPGLTDRARV